jgi:DnaA family protein
MQQLLLDIRPAPAPTLENFVVGANVELIRMLRDWQTGSPLEKALYIWGPQASGKTHLVRAMARTEGALLWNGQDEIAPDTRLVALDNVECLAETSQIAAFDAFNEARASGRMWLATGNNAPAALSVREDLRTRLGWGLVFRLQPLTDEDKQAALRRHAIALGFELDPAIASWLLTRHGRDLSYLLQVVEALDRYSLETRRRVTLPLLKALLA